MKNRKNIHTSISNYCSEYLSNLGLSQLSLTLNSNALKVTALAALASFALVAPQNLKAQNVTCPSDFTLLTGTPFGIPSPLYASLPASVNAVDYADINGDGKVDLVVGDDNGNLYWLENNSTSSISFLAPALIATIPGGKIHPTLADLDNDGDIDMLVGNTNGDLLYFKNTGSATVPNFSGPVSNPFSLTGLTNELTPEFADMDGDGDQDLFIGSTTAGVLYYKNTGNASNPIYTKNPTTNPFGLSDVTATQVRLSEVDIDNDGDFDFAYGDGNSITFYINTGTSTAPNFVNVNENFGLDNSMNGDYSVRLVDINGDNKFEAFVGNNTTGLYIYQDSKDFTNCGIVEIDLNVVAGYNSAMLTWTTEGNRVVREYEVYGDPGQFGTYFLLGYTSVNSYEAVGLLNGQNIGFRIRPIYKNGEYGLFSNTIVVKPSVVLGENESAKEGFVFFPNPNNGDFNLRLQDGSSSAKVSVINLSGQNVYTTMLDATQTSINLGNVAAGMYVVRVETNQGIYQQKVSVVR